MPKLLWVFFLLLLWCTWGCQPETAPPSGYEQPGGEDQQVDFLDQDRLSFYLQNELKKWSNPGGELYFSIEGSDQHLYHVYWENPDSWRIHWEKEADFPLLLWRNGSLYYKEENGKERLFEGEADFLLPTFHLQMILETIQTDRYEWLSVSSGKASVNISLYLPGDVLQSDFAPFFDEHHPLDQPFNLQLYGLLYHFELKEGVGREGEMGRLTFGLTYGGDVLERLTFNF